MKWPTFDDVENKYAYGRREYEVDESSYEHRKYKEPMRDVRVYQHGLVSVRWNGKRDPAWREEAWRKFNLRFILPAKLTGMRLYNPDTGARVVRKAMDTDPVFYDEVRGRVYSVNWGKTLDFVSPHAQPIPSHGIKHWCDNEEKYKAAMDRLRPYSKFGNALAQLDDHSGVYLDWPTRQKLIDPAGLPPYPPTNAEGREFCVILATFKGAVENAVRLHTRDTFTPNYLVVKPL